MTIDTLEDFLKAVAPPDGGWMQLCAFDPEDKRAASIALAWNRGTIDEAAEFARKHNTHRNIHWSVNPLTRRIDKKVKKSDVKEMRWVHADIDDASEEVLEKIRNYHPRPTLILFSGGGYQAFWALQEPVHANGNLEELESANLRVLQDLYPLDVGTRNLDRVMRVPFTTNWPNATKKAANRKATLATVVEYNAGRTVSLSDFKRPEPKNIAGGSNPGAQIKHKPKDKTQSADLMRQVRAAVAGGKTDDEVLGEFITHAHAAAQRDPQRAVQRCIEKARESWEPEDEQALTEMNAKYAVINWNGKARIITEIANPDDTSLGFELSSHLDFKLLLHTQWHNDSKLATWWLNQKRRREFKGVVFAPGRQVPGYYNMWRGFAYEPRPGDCSLWLQMVEIIICRGNKQHTHYVLSWCADLVQNPTARPGVVLVLKGIQGTGKGTLGRELCALFGLHAFHATSSRQLIGQFNKHLTNKLLVFADEAFYAGDKKSEGALKALITEPTMALEPKGQDIITVPNYVRIVMASNQSWVVPAALDDRRFAVFEVSEERAKDTEYFAAIHQQMQNGGRAALLHFLLHYDMRGIDLRKLPETHARWEQQLHSMTPIQKWWHGRLHSGAVVSKDQDWKTEALKEDVLKDYIEHAGVTGERFHACRTELGMELDRLVPGLRHTRPTRTGSNGESGKRCHAYEFPPLAKCRAEFTRVLGHEITWPEESAADLASSQLPGDY
jgi:hypothetical protein